MKRGWRKWAMRSRRDWELAFLDAFLNEGGELCLTNRSLGFTWFQPQSSGLRPHSFTLTPMDTEEGIVIDAHNVLALFLYGNSYPVGLAAYLLSSICARP